MTYCRDNEVRFLLPSIRAGAGQPPPRYSPSVIELTPAERAALRNASSTYVTVSRHPRGMASDWASRSVQGPSACGRSRGGSPPSEGAMRWPRWRGALLGRAVDGVTSGRALACKITSKLRAPRVFPDDQNEAAYLE